MYFQDHKPNERGYVKIDKNEASSIAEDFIKERIKENVDNIIVEKVINKILSK